MRVFNMILEHDTDGAVSLAREVVGSIANGEVEAERLVISRTCRSFDKYKDFCLTVDADFMNTYKDTLVQIHNTRYKELTVEEE